MLLNKQINSSPAGSPVSSVVQNCYRCEKSGVPIRVDLIKHRVANGSPCCDVSLELCYSDAEPRSWAPPLVTRFGVIPRV